MVELNAVVLENVKIGDDLYGLTFSTLEEIPVRAGQFCMIGVQGYPLRRPLAICKAEGERITVCYSVKGGGTRTLAETYKAGEKLSVLLPLGNGFPIADKDRTIALVGGGAGVFPLISVIQKYASERKIYSYMGFRTRNTLWLRYGIGKSEKLVLATDDGSMGVRGTAVQAFMQDVDAVRPDLVLACGPLPMLRALKSATAGRGLNVYVSLEERMGCGVGACLVCVCKKKDGGHARVCKDGPVFAIDEVDLNG